MKIKILGIAYSNKEAIAMIVQAFAVVGIIASCAYWFYSSFMDPVALSFYLIGELTPMSSFILFLISVVVAMICNKIIEKENSRNRFC